MNLRLYLWCLAYLPRPLFRWLPRRWRYAQLRAWAARVGLL